MDCTGNFVPRIASEVMRFVDMGFGATRIELAAYLFVAKCVACLFSAFLKVGVGIPK